MVFKSKKFYKKAIKVLRYIRIYGPKRTLAKIKAQFHLLRRKTFSGKQWINLSCPEPESKDRSVAIIGCGYYSHSVIAYYLSGVNRRFLRATFDIDSARAKSLCMDYAGAFATTEIDMILSDPHIKIVYIASNHASHAEYAERCILSGKDVHIEKPHVVSSKQLNLLTNVKTNNPNIKIFVGFNRHRSYLFTMLQSELKKYNGPLMINWFVVGHHLEDDHWYYNKKEGGRILGNLCHWSDLTLQLVGLDNLFPCQIIPSTVPTAKSDFIITINFAEGSSAVISFSAKGKTSEGVTEVLNLQKGDCIANLYNFEFMTLNSEIGKRIYKPFFRDHGHQMNILHSYNESLDSSGKGESLKYLRSTARLFLAIREAVELNKKINLEAE
jgi:predicted dehydrogenase